MKYDQLQKIDANISQKLDKNEFKEYGDMIRYLHKEILGSQMLMSNKIFLIQKINAIYVKYEDVGTTGDVYYENIIQKIKKTAEELIINLRHKEKIKERELYINEIQIYESDRKTLHAYGVEPLHADTVAYRGGKGRIVAKYMLGLPITEYDKTDDTDLIIDASQDRLAIAKQYECDTQGIRQVDCFDQNMIRKELQGIDCSLNQFVVMKDKIYITSDCEKSLRNRIIYPGTQTRDLYGKYVHETLQGKIYTGKALRRFIKPLTDGRVDTLQLPKHNLEKKNLEIVGFDKNILAHIRNYLEKPDEKQIIIYYRLAHILQQLNLIKEKKDIFPYLTDIIENKYPEFVFIKYAEGVRHEANWLMKKLFHIIRDMVEYEWGIHKGPIEKGYEYTSDDQIKISTTYEHADENFTKEYYTFKNMHKERFTLQGQKISVS